MKKIIGFLAALAFGAASANITVTPPPITPAAIVVQPVTMQPPAIIITTVAEIADLTTQGYTVTPPQTTTPPPPTTGMVVSPISGPWNGTIVDHVGNFDPYWNGNPTGSVSPGGGNWNSNLTVLQNQTAPDGGKALKMTPTGSFPILIQHPAPFPGFPSPNGIAIDLKRFTRVTATFCPTAAGIQQTLGFNSVQGAGTYVGPNPPVPSSDLPIQAATNFGVGLPANVCTVVTLPLSTLGIPDNVQSASTDVYKLQAQRHENPATAPEYVRDFGFLP